MAVTNLAGIDLGTANVSIITPDKGIVLNEPSVVAIDRDTDQILAVGDAAREMLGRTPGNMLAVRPLRDGVISDLELTERMLGYFIKKTCRVSRFSGPRIMICVPGGVTEVEKHAVSAAASRAGAKEVYLIEEPLAAAMGAGLNIMSPEGSMVVDIGGGTTDIAVISLGSIAAGKSIRNAGDRLDESIIKYMKNVRRLQIGLRTAENIKKTVGTAYPLNRPIQMECRGRNTVTGLPESAEVSSEEIYNALDESLNEICDTVRKVLEITPPELASDVSMSGIVLTGGGALLRGLDRRIEAAVRLPVYVAEDPLGCVVRGTGAALRHMSGKTAEKKPGRRK